MGRKNGSGAARATGRMTNWAGGSSWAGKRDRDREERPRDCSRGGETQEAGKFDDHCFSGRVVDSATLVMLRFTAERDS